MASDYDIGRFESAKFASRRNDYYSGLSQIKNMGYSPEDLIHYFPCFAGHLTISRYLAMYEAYKLSLGVSGHIAELGVYKGAGSLFFAKLTQIFEPNSLTLVHGFDWFNGTLPTDEEPNIREGSYREDYDRVRSLIEAQQLQNIVHLHKLDLRTELQLFFEKYPYMQFKLLFFDAGQYEIVSHALEQMWDRLTPGGVLLLDQYNQEISPGETRAVVERLRSARIRTFSWSWLPSAYIVKE